MNDRLLLRIGEVAALLALSRSKVYELVARGELAVVHIGTAARIPRDSVQKFVEQLSEQAGAAR